jgi:hypothetical protein
MYRSGREEVFTLPTAIGGYVPLGEGGGGVY